MPEMAFDEARVSEMKVTLTQPVEIALRTLADDDRSNVIAWLDDLKNWKDDDSVRQFAHQLDGGVYVLKATSDFRIFFRVENDEVVVLDIAKKSTILTFGHVAGHGRG